MSRSLTAAIARLTISMFSCDIARPVSRRWPTSHSPGTLDAEQVLHKGAERRARAGAGPRWAARRLLAELGGFEGFVAIEVGLEAHDLPITQLVDACYPPGKDIDAAVSPSRGFDTEHDDRFTGPLP